MGYFEITLVCAAFLCSLVAGFLFGFAVVVMPGMSTLSDREFIRAFQAIDRVIQNNQPIFMFVWVGSVLTLMAAAALGMAQMDHTERFLVLASTISYLIGVQLPTIVINVPLNHKLQLLDVDSMDESSRKMARAAFEPRWNRWNRLRTVFAGLASAMLLGLLFSI